MDRDLRNSTYSDMRVIKDCKGRGNRILVTEPII
jgi:hypothetical protein